jgi:hypothetical protein
MLLEACRKHEAARIAPQAPWARQQFQISFRKPALFRFYLTRSM